MRRVARTFLRTSEAVTLRRRLGRLICTLRARHRPQLANLTTIRSWPHRTAVRESATAVICRDCHEHIGD